MKLATIFQPTILLALALMAVIVMMILPMPPWVLDIGLAASFALAILIFTVTLFIEEPLDFSAFPTILLASLMLRLSLNVSSTKLIVGQGHTGTDAAGGVIDLDHLRAHARQQQGGVGPGQEPGQVENDHVVEQAGHGSGAQGSSTPLPVVWVSKSR